MTKKRNGGVMNKRKGSILVLSMFMAAMMILVAGVFLQLAVVNNMQIYLVGDRAKAMWIARAGVSQQVYDLKQYWFLYQQGVRKNTDGSKEISFSGGKYQVATATLIGRGFHKTIIVAIGNYAGQKECEAVAISMNTPTDYLLYVAPTGGAMPLSGVQFSGPIHVNGDLLITRHWETAFFLKNSNDYGPVLSSSRHIYYGTQGGGGKIYYGEGSMGSDGLITCTERKYIFDTSSIWPIGPFNYERFRDSIDVTKANPDGTEYTYKLIEDKTNGSTVFKDIPKTSEVSYIKYKKIVDQDWYITTEDTKGLTVVERTNEAFNLPTSYHGPDVKTKETGQVPLGLVPFGGAGNFTINVPAVRKGIDNMKYLRFLYFQDKSGIAWDVSPAETTTKDLYAVGVGQKGGVDGMNCYTIDRVNGSFTVKYPFIWHNFRFFQPPGNPTPGKIRGFRRKAEDKNNAGGLNKVLTIQHTPVIVDPDFAGMAKVYVSPGITYSDATAVLWNETADLSVEIGTAPVYQADYNAGTFTFGDNVSGKALPSPSSVRIVYTYYLDFDPNEMYAYIEATQKCVEINLDNITEENSPRDPSYPTDMNKRGVIFSEMPLIVWGTPAVPVTIICTEDVYVGPINTTYVNPKNVDNCKDLIVKSLKLNDPNAQPLGIMTKKFLWYDHTLAPFSSPNPFKAQLNSWATNEVVKKYIVNNTALYSGFMYDKMNTLNYYGSQFATHEIGVAGKNHEVGFGAGLSKYWEGEYDYMYPTRYFVGSLYKDNDSDAPKTIIEKNIFLKYYGNDAPDHVYSSSFRTKPPPHFPMFIELTNWTRIADVEKVQTFINVLDELIISEGTESSMVNYTPEFSEALTTMINEIEK